MSRSRLFIWWLGALSAYIAAYASFDAAGRLGLEAPLPVLLGVAAGVILIAIMLVFRHLIFMRGPAVVATEVDRDNQGNYQRAAWIIRRFQAEGVQHIDKLTPDGLICGYVGNDFSAEFEVVYAVDVGEHESRRLITRLEELTTEAHEMYQDPSIADGFILEFLYRDRDDNRRVRLMNVDHSEFFDFCRDVWQYAPDRAEERLNRNLPAGQLRHDDDAVVTW